LRIKDLIHELDIIQADPESEIYVTHIGQHVDGVVGLEKCIILTVYEN